LPQARVLEPDARARDKRLQRVRENRVHHLNVDVKIIPAVVIPVREMKKKSLLIKR
jgi:hypothetical protein